MMVERRNGLIAACMVLWAVQLSGTARAQSLRIALFKASSTSSELSPLTAALDPALQAEVGRVPKLSIAAVPPLDLPSMQLALDCVGETPSCLSVATERSKVDGLLSPTLSRSGEAIVLSLLLYNPAAASPLQVVTRSFPGEASDATVIAGAKSLVRELFGIPEPQAPAPVEEPPPAPTAPPAEATPVQQELQLPAASPEPAKSPSLLLPIVLGAAGVGVIAVGIGFGVASNNTEARYGEARIRNDANAEANAQKTSDLLSTAQTQSVIANVAFGLGAASCLAAGVVFFLQRSKHRPDTEPSAHVALGPGYVGVTGGF